MKRCGGCGETKPLDDFHRRSSVSDGRQAWCKPCSTAATLASRAKAPEKTQQAHRLRKYGLTADDYQSLLSIQAGRCGACDRPMLSPHVDHCHDCGQVRGLLCKWCNSSAGQVRDNPLRLARLLVWLLTHTDTPAPSGTDGTAPIQPNEGRSA